MSTLFVLFFALLTTTCKFKASPTNSSEVKSLRDLDSRVCGVRPERIPTLRTQFLPLISKDPGVGTDTEEKIFKSLSLLPQRVTAHLLTAAKENQFKIQISPGRSFTPFGTNGKPLLNADCSPALAIGAASGGSEGDKLTRIRIAEQWLDKEALLHEIGHAATDLVMSLNGNSKIPTLFNNLSAAEKKRMHPYYGAEGVIRLGETGPCAKTPTNTNKEDEFYKNDGYEWIAETFAMYYCSQVERDDLKNNFPESYKFAVTFFAPLDAATASETSTNNEIRNPVSSSSPQSSQSCERKPEYVILDGPLKGQTKAAHSLVRGPDLVCRDYDCPAGYFTSLNNGCVFINSSATCGSGETRDPLGNCMTLALFHARYDNPNDDTDRDGIRNQYDLCLGSDVYTHTPTGQTATGYIYPQGTQFSGCAPGQIPNFRQ